METADRIPAAAGVARLLVTEMSTEPHRVMLAFGTTPFAKLRRFEAACRFISGETVPIPGVPPSFHLRPSLTAQGADDFVVQAIEFTSTDDVTAT